MKCEDSKYCDRKATLFVYNTEDKKFFNICKNHIRGADIIISKRAFNNITKKLIK